MHSLLGLKCPCYSKHHVLSYGSGKVEKEDTKVHLEQRLNPYQKELMREKPDLIEVPSFIVDMKDWSRFTWTGTNFNGGRVGKYAVNVSYGPNVSGMHVSDTFIKRIKAIVTDSTGLVVSLKKSLQPTKTSFGTGSFIDFTFSGAPKAVQFAVLSPSFSDVRRDVFRVFVDGELVKGGEFTYGDEVTYIANTFMPTRYTADYHGHSDVLFNIRREQIQKVRVEFSNAARNSTGGRLALSDILVK